MSDTSPYFGVPQVAKMRKKEPKLHQDTWFDELLNGIFGKEAPSGSVLDEDRETRTKLNDVGQQIGIVANLLPALDALKAPALAAKALPKGLEKQVGAIRLGGAKDLVATHAFQPETSKALVETGLLDAPSIGITSRAANDYSSVNPQFVFAAGKTDPARYPGYLLNRDGYFARVGSRHDNFDRKKLADKADQYMGVNSLSTPDLRLTEMIPDGSQALAIAASPRFGDYASFEKAPYGAALLRIPEGRRVSYWNALDSAINRASKNSPHGKWGSPGYVRDLIRKVNEKGFQSLSREEQQLWTKAMESPSAMAEFKMMDHLPLSPADTAIYVPQLSSFGFDLNALAPFRDAGYKMFTAKHLDQDVLRGSRDANVGKKLPYVAQPDGTLMVPPKLLADHNDSAASRMWNDFMEPTAGGSPPLSKAPPLEANAISKGFDPAEYPDQFQAAAALNKFHEHGMVTDQEYFAGLDAINDKWGKPFEPSPEAVAKLTDAFKPMPKEAPDQLIWKPQEDSLEAPQAMEKKLTSDIPPNTSFKYNELIDQADEYALTMLDLFAKHDLPQELFPKAVDIAHGAFTSKLHTIDHDWHATLESYLKNGLNFKTTPEGDWLGGLPHPLPKYGEDAYEAIEKMHPGFWGKHQELLDKHFKYTNGTWNLDSAVEAGLISPEVSKMYQIWDTLPMSPAP